MQPDRVDHQLARDIVRYYMRNPGTVDTLEGLARWRLLEQQVRRTVREVGRVLSWLVEIGLLRELKRSGTPPLFGFNEKQIREALRFIEEEDQG